MKSWLICEVERLKSHQPNYVMQYKNAKTRNLREIAPELDVAYVLEGTVQLSGNRIRISA